MGLLYDDAGGMLEAKKRGISFNSVLTIGRLSLYLHPKELAAIGGLSDYVFGEFSDRFFREKLDTSELVTLDNSDYEGASRVHDMNQPLPLDLCGRFDAVIDGGSLEHIFNVPVSLANLMRAAKVGGSVFITTPANNLCGHGFYQFSPELMFRAFSPENGFEIRDIRLLRSPFPGVEAVPIRAVYRVIDPAITRQRVGLQSRHVAILRMEAIKRKETTPFAVAPQQSDYASAWVKDSATPERKDALRRMLDKFPLSISRIIRAHILRRRFSFANRKCYQRQR